jgi:putative thioredoxin
MDDQSSVFEVTPASFQTDVIERSQQQPVLVLFWAEQVAPAKEARDTLERLVGRYQGKVWLALVDVAQDQSLAQQLRVQGLPSIRVVNEGQLVEQLDGPQPEAALVALLDKLTLSSADLLQEQLNSLLSAEDYSAALAVLQQVIADEPDNQLFQVELADVLVRQGELAQARKVLEAIEPDTPDLERPQSRLAFADEAAELPVLDLLEQDAERDPDNLELCYQLAVVQTSAGNYAAALDQAMLILQRDRQFMDDIGRTTMLRIFALLGKGSDIASQYRRRMFTFMH